MPQKKPKSPARSFAPGSFYNKVFRREVFAISFQKVKDYFKGLGLEDRVLEFETSSATAELAARAVGCEVGKIAKTLSFKAGDGAVLVVAAGDARVDNAKFKAQFGTKAKMLSPDEVTSLVGYSVGSVCPFLIDPGVPIYLDISLKRFDEVYPACGSANSAVRLTIDELSRYSGSAAWVDVCKE